MLRRFPITAALAAASLLTLWPLLALAQVDGEQHAPGGTCGASAHPPTPGTADAPDWDTFFDCNGSTWQRGPYFFGPSTDSCDSNHAGMTYYNATNNVLELCNGTAWELIGSSSSSCGSPSGLSFTNVTGASLNTVYTSNTATITFSGCTTPYSVAVTGAATAQISVNGGAWSTSGAISSGQTLQVRMTTSGSVSTVLTATVTVGSSSTNWTTTTRSGSLQVFVTANTYAPASLGGLSGADAVCQDEAGTAGYAGTYMAILSSDTTSAASRLTLSYPIVNAYNGSTVAAANLWVGSISNDIYTPSGGTANTVTGTTPSGGIVTGDTCSSWTSSSGTDEYGNPASPGTSGWIDAGAFGCGAQLNLYCIQQ
jgi:hypothetical protein